jgi:predicted DNA-binding protein
MSDIEKIGHVVRIDTETTNKLSRLKKTLGIPKYKMINLAIEYWLQNNSDVINLVETSNLKKSEVLFELLKLKQKSND